ncbi:hypothetical protein DRN94_000425 [archaeon]|nr:hypothetical protein [archaeon]
MSDLDDLSIVREVDKQGMIERAARYPEQFLCGYRAGREVGREAYLEGVERVVFCGMGGSSAAALVLCDLLEDAVTPLFIHQGYGIPGVARSKNALCVIVSYSGNTEETLTALRACLMYGVRVICMSSGGILGEVARKQSLPWIRLPEGIAPREALPYMLGGLLGLLEQLQMCGESLTLELQRGFEKGVQSCRMEVRTEDNPAKQLAERLRYSRHIHVLGVRRMRGVAARVAAQLNENAKLFATHFFLPEFNHNEIVGLIEGGAENTCLLLLPPPPKNLEPYDELVDLLRLKGVNMISLDIEPTTTTEAEHVAYCLCTGDYASMYLAVLRGRDPYPVVSISELKKCMKERKLWKQLVAFLSNL